MDQVARRAGVSKITIYAHFASKQALLGAIVDELAGRLLSVIGGFGPGDLPPEEALMAIGRAYLGLALAPSSLALHRLVVSETGRQPKLGQVIHRSGPTPVVAALAEYLARQPALDIEDAPLAAEQFFGMILGHTQITLLLGARSGRAVRGEIERRVAVSVRVFLHGVARRPIP